MSVVACFRQVQSAVAIRTGAGRDALAGGSANKELAI